MDPVCVTWRSVDDLQRDMGKFDPANMCVRTALPGRGVPAGWKLRDMTQRDLGILLTNAYRQWPGEVKLTFEAPMEPDECYWLAPETVSACRLVDAAYSGDYQMVRNLIDSGVQPDSKV